MWLMWHRGAGARDKSPRVRRSTPPGRASLAWLLGSGAVAGASVVALRVRPPEEPGSWGFCPWLLVTGRPCPTCGGLRAIARLTHLDVAGALAMNAYVAVSASVLVVAWLAAALALVRSRSRRDRRASVSDVSRADSRAPVDVGWRPQGSSVTGSGVDVGPGGTRMAVRMTLALGWWAAGLLAFGALRLIPALRLPVP